MRLAVVCSAHGYGHLTRQLALGAAWRELGVDLTFFADAPPALVDERLPGVPVVPWRVDVGIAQTDSRTEDLPRTRALAQDRWGDAAIGALASALGGFDRVVVDAAPAALEAARRAGVPAVAIGNFDWAWIYAQYAELADLAPTLDAWQAPHPAASLWPGPGMRGFREVHRFGLVGAHARPAPLPPGSALVAFGGFGLRGLDAALPVVPGLRWLLPGGALPGRPDTAAPPPLPFPALVSGAELVLTKPGYSAFAECALAGTPALWLPRGAFPEAPWLLEAARQRGDEVLPEHLHGEDLSGAIRTGISRIRARPRPDPLDAVAVHEVARWALGARVEAP